MFLPPEHLGPTQGVFPKDSVGTLLNVIPSVNGTYLQGCCEDCPGQAVTPGPGTEELYKQQLFLLVEIVGSREEEDQE